MKRKPKNSPKIKRKNFLPALTLTLVFWCATAFLIYAFDPSSFFIITIFFVLIFLALFFTLSLIFANTIRGLIISVAVLLFLMLRYLGVGNILNFLLIIGITIATDLYFNQK